MLMVSPMRAQQDHGDEDRQRNRNGDDDGGAPIAEEQQDHARRQRRCDQAFAQHAADRGAHEQRLIEQRLDS